MNNRILSIQCELVYSESGYDNDDDDVDDDEEEEEEEEQEEEEEDDDDDDDDDGLGLAQYMFTNYTTGHLIL